MTATKRAFDQLPAAVIGKLGEVAGISLMKNDGASTISLCRIDDGGAPMLERGPVRGKLVLPDVQVFNWRAHPSACFVELKTYGTSKFFKIYNAQIHGVPVRLFDHYVKTQADTGLAVLLGINELDTGTLRISEKPISEITKYPCACKGGCRSVDAAKHVPGRDGIQEMQWYFDREEFSIVYKHDSGTIERLRAANVQAFGDRGHFERKHGNTKERFAERPKKIFPPDHPRDTCEICGDSAKTALPFIAITVEDAAGERVVCSSCWRKRQAGAA